MCSLPATDWVLCLLYVGGRARARDSVQRFLPTVTVGSWTPTPPRSEGCLSAKGSHRDWNSPWTLAATLALVKCLAKQFLSSHQESMHLGRLKLVNKKFTMVCKRALGFLG